MEILENRSEENKRESYFFGFSRNSYFFIVHKVLTLGEQTRAHDVARPVD